MAEKGIRVTLAACAAILLAACTGGAHQSSSGGTTGSAQYTMGGTVSGLSGSGLVLASNTGETLPVAADGSFTFKTTFPTGNPYYVLVLAQPSAPSQTCLASNGAGTVENASITGIKVVCTNKTAATDVIGGMVVGVTGSGLILQNNGTDNLAVAADGNFKFPAALPSGSQYDVTVLSPPVNPYEDCVVLNGKGTTTDSDIANIAVACTVNISPTHTIGGTVSGVSGTLVLQDNGRDDLTVTADGPFKFPLAIPSGGSYDVTTKSANGAQSQACTFTNATGMVGDSDITNVTIVCMANAALRAAVSGLSGTGLVLQNTINGDSLAVAANGTATFSAGIGSGGAYNVVVASQPTTPSQTCVVANGTGTGVSGTPVTVACTTNTYTVGGVVTGLPDPSSGATLNLVLQNVGGDTVTIAPTANSPVSFNFATPIASGSAYAVTVVSQPGSDTSFGTAGVVQTSTVCVVAAGTGTGTVTNGNVSGIVVNCVRPLGFAYVTNSGDNTISPYIIDSDTGALLPSGPPVSAGTAPSSLAVTDAYDKLYASNSGSNDLSGYAIDPNTGALTTLAGSPFPLGLNAPSSLAIYDAVDPGLYVTNAGNGTISGFDIINAPTSFPAITNSPFAARAGATAGLFFFGGAGLNQIYYYLETDAANDTLSAWAVDPETGALTLAPNSPAATETTPDSVAAIQTFSPALGALVDSVYVANSGTNTISTYSMNTQNGALTLQGAFNTAAGLRSVLMDGTYLLATTSQGVQAYKADSAGALTPVSNTPFAAGAGPGPLAALYNYVYVVNTADQSVSVFTQDSASGALTPVTGTAVATGRAPSSIVVVFRPDFGAG
jgi:lactonase family protein with 7-bladed beta-propeller